MYEYKATIIKIVDGDTVDVDIDLGFDIWRRNERIRLHGCDTPECRTRNKKEKAHGLLAKEYVQKALVVGRTYALTTKEKGKFGRWLGTIWELNEDKPEFENSYNKQLINEGLAKEYWGGKR